ncbi:hypothetical protein Pla22_23360 [Rubripirellula amarantea]|uniref:Uncharacterized protein n=2 Tax=Rubripirellula amarantea TaxID=2527999 RepID=A0A5C5WVJ4_9BACT|nr:hypothetical protein Pla22_23360 [Rubripirellula amarantea]
MVPDIAVGGLAGMYNADSDDLYLQGAAGSIKMTTDPSDAGQTIYLGTGGGGPKRASGLFMLNATVQDAGLVQPSATARSATANQHTFSITGAFNQSAGTLGTADDTNVVLLQGTLTEARLAAFETLSRIDFVATVTGGALSNLFEPEILIKVDTGSSFNSFAYTVNGFGAGSADVGKPVPEPASLAIWSAIAFAACCSQKRRKRVSTTTAAF